MANASTIRPGLLVGLKSTVVGGVSYQRVDLDASELDCPDCAAIIARIPDVPVACGTCGGTRKVSSRDGTEISRWETKRIIEDKAEHERAVKCRSAALATIRKCCSATPFGLLCPESQEGALDAAIAKAQELVAAHNANATHTRVGVYVLKGRVASDDAAAARAITQEIAELVTAMDAGIKAFDPKAIRDAANRAREMSSMLSEDKAAKIDAAIEQARKAARMITKNIEVEAEKREVVLLDIQRGQIESARIAFLDLSAAGEPTVGAEVPAPDGQRAVDLDDEDTAQPVTERGKYLASRRQLDMYDEVE